MTGPRATYTASLQGRVSRYRQAGARMGAHARTSATRNNRRARQERTEQQDYSARATCTAARTHAQDARCVEAEAARCGASAISTQVRRARASTGCAPVLKGRQQQATSKKEKTCARMRGRARTLTRSVERVERTCAGRSECEKAPPAPTPCRGGGRSEEEPCPTGSSIATTGPPVNIILCGHHLHAYICTSQLVKLS